MLPILSRKALDAGHIHPLWSTGQNSAQVLSSRSTRGGGEGTPDSHLRDCEPEASGHCGCLCAHEFECVLVYIHAGHLYPCSMCQSVDQPSAVTLYISVSLVLPEAVWSQAPQVCVSAPGEAVSMGVCILCAGSVGRFSTWTSLWSWGCLYTIATCQAGCMCLYVCVLVRHAQMCTVLLRLESCTCLFLPC